MSDLSLEALEYLKSRDERVRALDLGLEVRAALEDSRPLSVLMSRLLSDAEKAMQEFANANCGDTSLIMGLQSRVFRYIYLRETLEAIMASGQFAEQSLIAEDRTEIERHPDD